MSTSSRVKHLLGALVVAAGMLLLFLPFGGPYFLYGVFVSTSCMIGVAVWLTGYKNLFKPSFKSLGLGVISALALYGLFYGGNILIQDLKPFGMQASSESTIYSLIAAHPLNLQILILALDAVGFESYFRGTLQNRIAIGLKSKAVISVFLAAAVDASIHVISLNPLWVITTFIADSVWGLTFFYTKDLSSSVASHFIWDIAIFIVFPIR